MRHWTAALAIAVPVVATPSAFAQSNPSVEQIIKSLTPTGDVSRAATRGIRLSPPSEARPTGTSASSVAATGTNPKSNVEPAAPTIDLTVNFATGSAGLTPQAVAMLDRLGTALSSSALSTYRFRIEGHTDTVGTREFNRTLSERRAEAVVAYLRETFKVDASRLVAVGLGPDRPLVVTADQVDEPRNRRVQVTNIGG